MPVLYITVGLSSGVAIKSGSTVGFKTAFNLCTVEADLLHILLSQKLNTIVRFSMRKLFTLICNCIMPVYLISTNNSCSSVYPRRLRPPSQTTFPWTTLMTAPRLIHEQLYDWLIHTFLSVLYIVSDTSNNCTCLVFIANICFTQMNIYVSYVCYVCSHE